MLVQNTVFISYRRTNIYIARALYQELKKHNYDCFLDYNSIDNGSFERIILGQIRARGHFILVLTPTTLERCTSPEDWVRREIECALEHQRNIVPIMFDDFDFAKHGFPYLEDKLDTLPKYNALRIHADYFEEGVTRLVERFLSKPIDTTLHPIMESVTDSAVPNVSLDRLCEAEEIFEQGTKFITSGKWKEAWDTFSKVIEITPENAEAYFRRAHIAHHHSKLDLAISEITKSIEYDTQNFLAYCRRGHYYRENGQLIEAIADYSEALRLNPPYIGAFLGRGEARLLRDDCDRAISDFESVLKLSSNNHKAAQLMQDARKRRNEIINPLAKVGNILGVFQPDFQPETALEYYERGIKLSVDDFDKRIRDFSQALDINPTLTRALVARANTYYHHGEFELSVQDDSAVLKLMPNNHLAYGNRGETYLAMEEFSLARNDLEKSLELKPDSVHPQTALAIALFHLGELDTAKNMWLELEKKRSIVRNIDRTAYRLNWHDKIAELAKPLIEVLG